MFNYKNYWKPLSIVLCQLSIVSLILLSCSREELLSTGDIAGIDPVGDDSLAVAFSAGSFREEWADADSTDTGNVGTRATDTSWTTGDAVGIFMFPSTGADSDYLMSSTYWKNRKYIVDASSKLNPDGTANKLYFPLDGSSVRFIAYYPYWTNMTTDYAYSMKVDFTDQSTKEKKESKDFCFSRGMTDYKKGDSPQFTFSHKFSKIRVTVKQGFGGSSVKDIKMKLSNMPKYALGDMNYFSRMSGGKAPLYSDVTEITACTLSSSETEATVEAIVAPHNSATNFVDRKLIFTTTDGKEKTYELPNDVTFEEGKVYSYTFVLEAATKVADGMTNCYIVAPGTELGFPVFRAYTHTNDGTELTTTLHTGGTYTGTFTAAVVWADAAVISGIPTVTGSGKDAIVTVKTVAGISGNAVVKIYKSADTTNKVAVWSYHIWVTSEDPTKNKFINTYNTNNKSSSDGRFVFMDRNLGATKASLGSGKGTGLFYQWGRKDPFPATDAVTTGSWSKNETSPTLGTIVNTIQNPGVFLLGVFGSEYDWLAERNNILWGHASDGSIKTIYDPCPSGWRVPVNYNMSATTSPWSGFTIDYSITFANGHNFGTNALYPAAGYRYYSSGNLGATGSYCLYWSASPNTPTSTNSDDALSMNFSSSLPLTAESSNRAYGYSVRCVQE
jgi:hypothetical protein